MVFLNKNLSIKIPPVAAGFVEIKTDKYYIIWRPDSGRMSIRNRVLLGSGRQSNEIMSLFKKIDMSYFADIKEDIDICNVEILNSSVEFVNYQIERLLTLKAFM